MYYYNFTKLNISDDLKNKITKINIKIFTPNCKCHRQFGNPFKLFGSWDKFEKDIKSIELQKGYYIFKFYNDDYNIDLDSYPVNNINNYYLFTNIIISICFV